MESYIIMLNIILLILAILCLIYLLFSNRFRSKINGVVVDKIIEDYVDKYEIESLIELVNIKVKNRIFVLDANKNFLKGNSSIIFHYKGKYLKGRVVKGNYKVNKNELKNKPIKLRLIKVLKKKQTKQTFLKEYTPQKKSK